MARAQADRVVRLLTRAHPGLRVHVVARSAPGDRHRGPLGLIGGKQSWVRQLDAALAAGEADLTVSCAKDLPGAHERPPGTEVGAVLAREDVRDVLLWPAGRADADLDTLPPGARVGTGAPRRIAQLSAARPDLEVVPVRGNLGARLRRHLDGGDGTDEADTADGAGEADTADGAGEADGEGGGEPLDALVVARAGLARTGLLGRPHRVLPPERMTPAAGAGIIVVEHRAGDRATAELLAPLNDPVTYAEFTAERAALSGLRGDCATACSVHAAFAAGAGEPAGGFGEPLAARQLTVVGRVFAPYGETTVAEQVTGPGDRPEALGGLLAERLLAAGAGALLPGGADA